MATQTTTQSVTAKTVRDTLALAGINAGVVGTVTTGAGRWIRAGVHPDDSKAAADALRAAFPDRHVFGFHTEVRVCATP